MYQPNVGDMVRYKTGGPSMVVQSVSTACQIPSAQCVWHVGDVRHVEYIPFACLRADCGCTNVKRCDDHKNV